jgi:hypothetical protein
MRCLRVLTHRKTPHPQTGLAIIFEREGQEIARRFAADGSAEARILIIMITRGPGENTRYSVFALFTYVAVNLIRTQGLASNLPNPMTELALFPTSGGVVPS